MLLPQLREALAVLFKLGDVAQRFHYQRWFAAGCASTMRAGDVALIDSVQKIDISNTAQMLLLHRAFARNREVIFFWLEHCCLPGDMQQYPSRLRATAWHLASRPGTRDRPGNFAVGFSGTNDLHRLLPLQVWSRAACTESVHPLTTLHLAGASAQPR